jgi:O-Antigen ligase
LLPWSGFARTGRAPAQLMTRRSSIPLQARAPLIGAASLVLLALAIDDGSVGTVFGVIATLLVIFAMTKMPLRQSMTGILFFTIVLPNPSEGLPTSERPPFFVVGQAFLTHLNTFGREGFLGLFPVSILEILIGAMFVIQRRRNLRAPLDGVHVSMPQPMRELAFVALGAGAFTWISGLLRGGDFSMSLWQLNTVIYIPLLLLLMNSSLRGPEDYPAIARAFLTAGCYKSVLAYYVRNYIPVPADPNTGDTRPPYGTTHHDSMLFAMCYVILLVPLLDKPDRKAIRNAQLILPVITLGIVGNNRRLAWVQIAVAFIIGYLVSRESRIKRLIRRGVVAAIPFFLVYVAAGWNSSGGGVFKPVQMIRSVVDAETDASSLWREIENYDIVATFRMNPIFGTGYGHPYVEFIPLPAVAYPLESFIPHNSLLGLWAYAGLIGHAGVTALWVAGLYFCMRAYHASPDKMQRDISFVSFAGVPIYVAQSWGDIGLGTWTGAFIMSTCMALGGKVAVVNGQWPGGGLRSLGKGRAR